MVDKTNTPDEIIDLVNEKDEIIGQTTKGEANCNPSLIHREVSIFLYDPNSNKLLFQQRSSKKKVAPSLWSTSAGGHVPKDVDQLQAAHMELEEELGFDTDLVFIDKILLKYENETHFKYYYLGKYEGQAMTIEPEEVQQIKLISQSEMENMIKQDIEFSDSAVEMALRIWNKIMAEF